MSVLIDTSVWIDYFRSGLNCENLDGLIEDNLVVTNDLILAELIPFLKLRKQHEIIELLNNIGKLTLAIDWDQIIEFQYLCLRSGLNGIGIPDLIIFQNAQQNRVEIYSLDKHFKLMNDILDFSTL